MRPFPFLATLIGPGRSTWPKLGQLASSVGNQEKSGGGEHNLELAASWLQVCVVQKLPGTALLIGKWEIKGWSATERRASSPAEESVAERHTKNVLGSRGSSRLWFITVQRPRAPVSTDSRSPCLLTISPSSFYSYSSPLALLLFVTQRALTTNHDINIFLYFLESREIKRGCKG